MNVLVVGGSGFIGTRLSRELIDRGHDVTVLSRNPDADDLPDGVETAMGDVTAYESIEAHFDGVDAVVFLVALSPLFEPKGGNRRHDEIHRGGTANCIRAAENHGVERFVQMSALGADSTGETHYIRAKGRADEIVRASSLDWVIFQPSIVFGDGGEFVSFVTRLKGMFAPGVPVYPLPGGGRETRFQPIWVGDLVGMIADGVEEDRHVGQTYEIGGPEIFTLREVTDLVYESRDESVKIVSLPMGLAGIGLKALGNVPGFPMGGDQYRSLKLDNTTAENDVETFERQREDLQRFREYLGVE